MQKRVTTDLPCHQSSLQHRPWDKYPIPACSCQGTYRTVHKQLSQHYSAYSNTAVCQPEDIPMFWVNFVLQNLICWSLLAQRKATAQFSLCSYSSVTNISTNLIPLRSTKFFQYCSFIPKIQTNTRSVMYWCSGKWLRVVARFVTLATKVWQTVGTHIYLPLWLEASICLQVNRRILPIASRAGIEDHMPQGADGIVIVCQDQL